MVMVGTRNTVMLAVAVLPVPPLSEDTVTELFCTPSAMPVTFTTSRVQVVEAASVDGDRVTEDAPAVAVKIPQFPLTPAGVETTNPAGRVSVKATPVRAVAFGLVMVNSVWCSRPPGWKLLRSSW